MKRVTPIRSNPTGRLDLLVSRLAEETFRVLIQPRSEVLWNALQPEIAAAAKKTVRKLGVSRKALTPDELKLITDLLTPKRGGLKCTA